MEIIRVSPSLPTHFDAFNRTTAHRLTHDFSQSTSTTVAPVVHMESICIRVQAWMSRLIKMLTANNTSSTI